MSKYLSIITDYFPQEHHSAIRHQLPNHGHHNIYYENGHIFIRYEIREYEFSTPRQTDIIVLDGISGSLVGCHQILYKGRFEYRGGGFWISNYAKSLQVYDMTIRTFSTLEKGYGISGGSIFDDASGCIYFYRLDESRYEKTICKLETGAMRIKPLLTFRAKTWERGSIKIITDKELHFPNNLDRNELLLLDRLGTYEFNIGTGRWTEYPPSKNCPADPLRFSVQKEPSFQVSEGLIYYADSRGLYRYDYKSREEQILLRYRTCVDEEIKSITLNGILFDSNRGRLLVKLMLHKEEGHTFDYVLIKYDFHDNEILALVSLGTQGYGDLHSFGEDHFQLNNNDNGFTSIYSLKSLKELLRIHPIKDGYLWSTNEKWFWTDKPELVQVGEYDSNGKLLRILDKNDPRRLEYIKIYNNREMVMTRLNDPTKYNRLNGLIGPTSHDPNPPLLPPAAY